ncbi:phage integrase SAM-like domain-containing protein [Paenibacillus sp. 8b26]|uniref:phage integrase SAM-like domain-containing protein n=1 Tax=Paenibacillus sp. 8b26 TaxID=3424133 RepID=UPI003D64C177
MVAGHLQEEANGFPPNFREKGIYLKELQPKHLQDFYQHVLKEFGLTTNIVLLYHANIRQALQHAFETDMIPSNPADKVRRLKKDQFIGSYYTSDELNDLFEVVKGGPVGLAVILTAFTGCGEVKLSDLNGPSTFSIRQLPLSTRLSLCRIKANKS